MSELTDEERENRALAVVGAELAAKGIKLPKTCHIDGAELAALTLSVGVYAPPAEWKKADEQPPLRKLRTASFLAGRTGLGHRRLGEQYQHDSQEHDDGKPHQEDQEDNLQVRERQDQPVAAVVERVEPAPSSVQSTKEASRKGLIQRAKRLIAKRLIAKMSKQMVRRAHEP